jgi:rare lipoprotein A (peptidoglycan hydrolase)
MKITSTILTLLLGAGLAFASDPSTAKGTQVVTTQAQHQTEKAEMQKTKKIAHKKPTQVGAASWYGKGFQGRPTASGEPYDMYQYTAASKSLPLGSWVKVTNLRNGKWLIVKVNDRGPYVGNRIMDLSYSAAKQLDFKSRGITKVKLELVEPEIVADSEVSTMVAPLD